MCAGTTLRTINKHAAIHVCLIVFFAFSWFIHCLACKRMEVCNRQFLLMDDTTLPELSQISSRSSGEI
jgi:hypothetical protein